MEYKNIYIYLINKTDGDIYLINKTDEYKKGIILKMTFLYIYFIKTNKTAV
jgi:hypothetical protein